MTDTCSICVESYNKRNRARVECPYCQYTACRTCCQTYLLGETIPRCMNPDCAKEWTLHFLRSAFPNTFMNSDLKSHREDVLFQQEVALLPATQPLVEREIQREATREEIRVINAEIYRLTREVETLWNKYHSRAESTQNARAEFVRNCPATDCRGFLSSQWKCGICANWTCPTCHEVKGPDRNVEHTCDPANVATAELLSRDTRHCPKCATPIFKIDGCDQMWCTQCQTGFSWRTGRIESNVHNPHYFEWLRRTGGQVAARIEPCGANILTHRLMSEFERLLVAKHCNPSIPRESMSEINERRVRHYRSPDLFRHPEAEKAYDWLASIIRSVIHLQEVERFRFRNDRILDNQDLRIQYMRNQLSAEKFKTLIQQRNKKQRKNREITDVLEIVIHTSTDVVFRYREYLANSPPTECDLTMLEEIVRMREYANECLRDISHTYGSVLLTLVSPMRLTTGVV